jgi:glutamate-1-semialdehyde 2,1-aminomutase
MYDKASIERLNRLGDRLREGFSRMLKSAGILGYLGGRGSLLSLHLGEETPLNAADAARRAGKNKPLLRLLHLQLANLGVHSAPRGMYIVSTPMSQKEVDQAIGAFKETLALVKPAVQEGWPHLMVT